MTTNHTDASWIERLAKKLDKEAIEEATKDYTMSTTYRTQVYIWSDIGHTPITGRKGGFQDELVNTFIDCTDPADALAKVLEIKKATPHAHQCYFNMVDYPNQNTKSKFCHYGKA